jgi:hypothetical protein
VPRGAVPVSAAPGGGAEVPLQVSGLSDTMDGHEVGHL